MTVSVNEVVVTDLDVRIQDGGHVSSSLFDLFVHLSEISGREVLRVETEIFVAIGLTVEIGPLDVHDEYINRELVVRELPVPVHDDLRRGDVIFREVEAKCVQRW